MTHQATPGAIVSSPITTTAGNELLVAFASSDGPDAPTSQSFVSVSGAGLTWTLRQRANAQAGTAEVWTAVAPTALSGAVITASRLDDDYVGALTVVAFGNADTANAAVVGGTSAPTGAPTLTLGTVPAGSQVWAVGSDWDHAVTPTPGAGQSLDDAYLAITWDTFWVQHLGPTAGAGSVTVNDLTPTTDRWNLSAIAIAPAPLAANASGTGSTTMPQPLTVDASTVSHQAPGSPLKSAPILTAGTNELLVAFAASDGPSKSASQSFTSVTGGGLTWHLRKRANAQAGTAEIWTAVAPSAASVITVTATRQNDKYGGSLAVVAFKNADLTSPGLTGGNSASSGAPSVTVSSVDMGSEVWAVGADWDSATTPIPGAGQTVVDSYLMSTGDTFWLQRLSAVTTTGPATVNDLAPVVDQWNLAAIEITPVDR